MISPIKFYNELVEKGINFFTGVPDSTLKGFCRYVSTKDNHVIAANEGTAISMAAGSYLATGKLPLVYMQNSGLGNATNPLISLVSKEVYSIPMILLIGWRGGPGTHDEPQHVLQGRIMIQQLKLMGIEYSILDPESYSESIDLAIKLANENSCPVALVSQKVFDEWKYPKEESLLDLTREDAIRIILDNINSDDVIVSTTGYTSRELFTLRKERGEKNNDFISVGSMGHASQIALGVALHTKKRVICLDGDGAMIMHMGGLTSIRTSDLDNLIHIVFNNSSHESVGGIPTSAEFIDLSQIALSLGYSGPGHYGAIRVRNEKELINALNETGFIEVLVKKGVREGLPRPDLTPIQNKENFMDKVMDWEFIWNNKKIKKNNNVLEYLISADGFENIGKIKLDNWNDYVKYIFDRIGIEKNESVFEAGCGAGAFLYPLYTNGIDVSGCDYSEKLISIAKKEMKGNFFVSDINDINTDNKYDHVISNSVFQYFPDLKFARKIVKKLVSMSNKSISILDVNDLEKLDLSVKRTPSHLFYSKDWWVDLAKELNLEIDIVDQNIKDYKNCPIRYNVFLRK